MTKKETQHFIDTILKQQATISTLTEKVRLLETIIDTLSKELEMCRKEGKL